MVSFVDDNQIVRFGRDHPTMLRPASCCQRCNDARKVGPGILAQRAEVVFVARDKIADIELGCQFFLPLPNQSRRSQNQHATHHLTQHILLEHQPGLDGFAQADFVAEQCTAAEAPQRGARCPNLIVKRREADGVQSQQIVKPLDQIEPIGHQLQVIGA